MPSPTQSPQLLTLLPTLLAHASEWAREASSMMLIQGEPLPPSARALARRVGVGQPEKIRLWFADELPLPDHPMLRDAAAQTGLLGGDTAGLTLGYGIYIRRGLSSPRLLSHEFRHVHQYEQAGSMEAFVDRYLREIIEFGYVDAPMEIDARAHELDRRRRCWRYR